MDSLHARWAGLCNIYFPRYFMEYITCWQGWQFLCPSNVVSNDCLSNCLVYKMKVDIGTDNKRYLTEFLQLCSKRLMVNRHGFIWCPGADRAINHCMNQWWLPISTHKCVIRPEWNKRKIISNESKRKPDRLHAWSTWSILIHWVLLKIAAIYSETITKCTLKTGKFYLSLTMKYIMHEALAWWQCKYRNIYFGMYIFLFIIYQKKFPIFLKHLI